jgi:hypothetical protein
MPFGKQKDAENLLINELRRIFAPIKGKWIKEGTYYVPSFR